MSEEIVLAAVCMHVEHDKQVNLKKHVRFIEEAYKKSARILVFPECSLQGYTWSYDTRGFFEQSEEQERYFQQSSESVSGPSTRRISKLASQYNMYVQFGMAERGGDGKTYNSAVLVGPEDALLVHRKVHMAPNPVFSSGNAFSVLHTEIGEIGSVVCADVCYPESVRVLALRGADVVLNSTSWLLHEPESDRTAYREYAYELMLRGNALLNRVWLIASDQVGASTKATYEAHGHSCIIDPWGRVVANSGRKEDLITLSVDLRNSLEIARSGRYLLSSLRRRHPESYDAICRE